MSHNDNHNTQEPIMTMTAAGWEVVDTAERMFKNNFTPEQICTALDLDIPHLRMMLVLAATERRAMEQGLRGE